MDNTVHPVGGRVGTIRVGSIEGSNDSLIQIQGRVLRVNEFATFLIQEVNAGKSAAETAAAVNAKALFSACVSEAQIEALITREIAPLFNNKSDKDDSLSNIRCKIVLLKYKSEVEEIRLGIFGAGSAADQNFEATVAAKISASLFNLLPEITVADHDALIKNIYFHQRWAIHDQYYLAALTPEVEIAGAPPNWREIDTRPAIFCTFHIGSYRLILPYLLKRGVKVTLLIDEHVAKMQSKKFLELLEEFRQAHKLSADCFSIKDTSNGNIILSLLRDLKNGRSLLIFVDGNTGVGTSATRDESLSPVQFLGATLMSRKGVGYISWMSACPVVPMVICRRATSDCTNELKFFPSITPSRDHGREQFCADVMTGLYAVLDGAVREFYKQWESWRYIERSLDISQLASRMPEPLLITCNDESLLGFNGKRYLLTRHPESHVLFDRASYRSTFISDELCDFFEYLSKAPAPKEKLLSHPQMSEGALKTMVKLGVIEVR